MKGDVRATHGPPAGSPGQRSAARGFVIMSKGPRSIRVRLTVATRSLNIEKWRMVKLGWAPCHGGADVGFVYGPAHWANREFSH